MNQDNPQPGPVISETVVISVRLRNCQYLRQEVRNISEIVFVLGGGGQCLSSADATPLTPHNSWFYMTHTFIDQFTWFKLKTKLLIEFLMSYLSFNFVST